VPSRKEVASSETHRRFALTHRRPHTTEPEELAEALKAFRAALEPLDPITRQSFRGAAVTRIEGLGVRAPAATIDAVFAGLGAKPGKDVVSEKLTDPEPWDASVDGGDLLDEMAERFSRHLVLPRYGAEALALWTLHTFTYDFGEITPRLAVTSPEKRCGKSSLLNILGAACSRPLPAANISSAAVFRSIERWKPTLLVDEADTFLCQNDSCAAYPPATAIHGHSSPRQRRHRA
jgi:putative DNA primase/helicase